MTAAAERTFVHLDFGAISSALRLPSRSDEWMASWLTPTWEDPAGFRRAFYADLDRRRDRPRVRPEVGADLYADCVLNHIDQRRTALTWSEREALAVVSYEQLHERSTSLLLAWRDAGLVAGASIAIVLPVGIDYLVALVTALRMGLVAAPVPPLGAAYVAMRLEQLGPADHVTTRPGLRALVPADAPYVSVTAPRRSGTEPSHTYRPDEVVLRLVSAFGPYGATSDLTAAELHFRTWRDARLVWAFDASDHVAMPGLDAVQTQPLSILSVLVAGATWVEVTADELEKQPDLLLRAGVTVLGVARRARAVLLATPDPALPPLRAWFRLLNETFDFERWEQLRTRFAKREIPSFGVLPNSASGGAHLFSQPTLDAVPTRIWPVAGQASQLSQIGTDAVPSFRPSGVYTPLVVDPKTKKGVPDTSFARVVMARRGSGLTYGGSIETWPDGRALPLRRVAAVAEQDRRVGAAAAIVVPGQWANEASLVLALFVTPEAADRSDSGPPTLADDVRATIRRELGSACVPERVDVLPLHPFMKAGEVDADWFRPLYLSGALHARAREDFFVALGQLAWLFEARSSCS